MDEQEVLLKVALTPPRQICEPVRLRALYDECSCVGLIKEDKVLAPDEEILHQLHALFDVSLQNNLVSVILHYIDEVVLDELAVSSNDVEAKMMDGDQVFAWVKNTTADIHTELESSTAGDDATDYDKLASMLTGLVHVLSTLSPSTQEVFSSAATDAPSQRQLNPLHQEANHIQLLQQYATVMAWWSANKQSLGSSALGHYSGQGAWQEVLTLRRRTVYPLNLTLDELWTQLGSNPAFYPPPDIPSAIRIIFLEAGEADSRAMAWSVKRSLFVYYLLDLGHALEGGLPASFAAAAALSARQLHYAHLLFLLDDHQEASLDAACRLLPSFADASTDFKVVRLLDVRARPDVALAVLRARGEGATTWQEEAAPSCGGGLVAREGDPLEVARAALSVRLKCGLLTDAFVAMRRYCNTVPGALRPAHTRTLLEQLLLHCQGAGHMDWLLTLPLAQQEEEALNQILQPGAGGGEEGSEWGGSAALEPQSQCFLPLYYTSRCRFLEAARCMEALTHGRRGLPEDRGTDMDTDSLDGASTAAARSKDAVAIKALQGLVLESVSVLPEVQKRLCLSEEAEPSVPLQVLQKPDGDARDPEWTLQVAACGANPPPLYTMPGTQLSCWTPSDLPTVPAPSEPAELAPDTPFQASPGASHHARPERRPEPSMAPIPMSSHTFKALPMTPQTAPAKAKPFTSASYLQDDDMDDDREFLAEMARDVKFGTPLGNPKGAKLSRGRGFKPRNVLAGRHGFW